MNTSIEQLQHEKQQAQALLHAGRLAEAQSLFTRICEQDATDVDAWYFLSCIYGMQGNTDEAGRCCRRVIALHPDHSDAHVNLGNVLLSQGMIEEAMRHYRTAVRANPNDARALCSLGSGLASLDRHDDAAKSFQAAIRLNPSLVEAYYNLGNSQMAQKKFNDAADSFRNAVRLNPSYAAAYNNLGNAHTARGEIAPAIENYRAAIRLQPSFAMAYNNIAIVLMEQGQLQEAYAAARRALQIRPDFTEALFSISNICINQGDANIAIEYLQRLLEIEPDHYKAHTYLLTMMHYASQYSAEQLFSVAQEWAARNTHPRFSLPPTIHSADPQRPLRVGYVSGDFYNHPVGYFIEAVFAHHDRLRYEVFCYYNHDRQDDLTSRLQNNVDCWQNIADETNEMIISRIQRDDIDILVDLSGHTDRNRLLVFSHKPAPIQVTWLGYFDTTGLSSIDYIIGDRFVIPPEEEVYYTERVVRLPDAYLCFSSPDFDIEVGPLPALMNGKITFGCFNYPAKINELVITCWSNLLRSLPQSRLYLKYRSFGDNGVRQRYLNFFAQQGIPEERICFSGYSPRHDYLETYREIDIALDPFPFNGCTTTMESLWMGVPVITLRGDRYVSHMGETILKHLGLEEYVAKSEDAYIANAIALASDLPRLAALRNGLRQRLLDSPLCDGAGFSRSLEAAYRRMWETLCSAQRQSN